LPFVKLLLNKKLSAQLKTGIQVRAGKVSHEQLARDAKRPYTPL
jgi:hypothetical protein